MYYHRSSMSDSIRRFNLFRVIVISFIVIVFLGIVLYWSSIGFVVFTAANKVSEQDFSGGIKPVIETVWCGKPGCMDSGK